MAMVNPMDGLRPGMLVQVQAGDKELDGTFGVIAAYAEAQGTFTVNLADGSESQLAAGSLRVPEALQRPGMGGGPASFDMLIGPKIQRDVMAEEMAACLFEKGFCVMRTCTSPAETEAAVTVMKDLADRGKLQRLPEEVEEGYLGAENRGKVIWMDPFDFDAPNDKFFKGADDFISSLASAIQPYCADILGKDVDERTPALVSLSLTNEEEPEYPSQDADDRTLGSFLEFYRRNKLQVVHFAGPATPQVTLEMKDDLEEGVKKPPTKPGSVEIEAAPNTILVFRADIFSYICRSEEEALSLSVGFLEASGGFEVDKWEGDTDFLLLGDGPGKPPGETINVVNLATRIMANWDEAEMYGAGLFGGCDSGVEIPLTRWNVYLYWDADTDSLQPWMTPTRHQSMVEGVELFDNKFFEIATNEVRSMDPMQRMTLEVGAKNLFKMGITKKVANRNPHHGGCSVGLDKDDWDFVQKEPYAEGGTNVQAIISNRFSFIFNLRGPNYVADTACSASLCATHLAKYGLRDREIDKIEFHIGIGLHLCLVQRFFAGGRGNTMNSPIGRCLTFNATASGYMRGDGCSGLTLKYGNQPETDAVWRASFCGQNGRSATLTAPNGLAQGEVIDKSYKEARISPVESCIWSCHGTGTSLGDPIEVGAIRRIQIKEDRAFSLTILTNKTHTGHLEGGAAMTSLIAAVLMCKTAGAVPCNHLRQLNPNLEQSAFDSFYNSELNLVRHGTMSYTQNNVHVSSFGFGGTNGHCILWGASYADVPDIPTAIRRKLKRMGPPEVRVNGSDPSQWEWDGPDYTAKVGDKYRVEINEADAPGTRAVWQKAEDSAEPDDGEDDFYCITGPFNDWDADRMEDGTIVGLRSITLVIPDDGEVEFRFLKNGEEDQVIYPAVDKCSRKAAPVLGPAAEDKGKEKHTWLASGTPGGEVKIDLFICRSMRSVMWKEV